MEQRERIAHYEHILDQANAACAQLAAALDAFRAAQPAMRELAAYYTGPAWREDFAADEAGLLPVSLKRGVLSEDAVGDALDENRQLMADMLALVGEALQSGGF